MAEYNLKLKSSEFVQRISVLTTKESVKKTLVAVVNPNWNQNIQTKIVVTLKYLLFFFFFFLSQVSFLEWVVYSDKEYVCSNVGYLVHLSDFSYTDGL